MTLTPVVEPLVKAHENWAFRTVWFFAFFASLRLAVSYIFPPRPVILLLAFVLAVGGLVMLAETAEHGAILVYKHGLGVKEPIPDSGPLIQSLSAAIRIAIGVKRVPLTDRSGYERGDWTGVYGAWPRFAGAATTEATAAVNDVRTAVRRRPGRIVEVDGTRQTESARREV